MCAPYLVVCPSSILLFFLKIGQMVICPIRGTYNHETNLTRVNSFNNICFKFKFGLSAQTRQFRGNTANAGTIPGGSRLTLLISLKFVGWLCPATGTVTTYRYFLAPK